MNDKSAVRCIYKIHHRGDGENPGVIGSLEIRRHNYGGGTLLHFDIHAYQEARVWDCGPDGPFVFIGDDLPIVKTTGSVSWGLVLSDPDDCYRSLQMWGDSNGQQKCVPLLRPKEGEKP